MMEASSTERFANPYMYSLVSSVTQTETQPKFWGLYFAAVITTAQVHSALTSSSPIGQRCAANIFSDRPTKWIRLSLVRAILDFMVHEAGLEPARTFAHYHLKVACLPFHHSCI